MATLKTSMRHAFENIAVKRTAMNKEGERIGGMIFDAMQHGAGIKKVDVQRDAIIASPVPNSAPVALEGVGLA